MMRCPDTCELRNGCEGSCCIDTPSQGALNGHCNGKAVQFQAQILPFSLHFL
jgi:hypothetical protein